MKSERECDDNSSYTKTNVVSRLNTQKHWQDYGQLTLLEYTADSAGRSF